LALVWGIRSRRIGISLIPAILAAAAGGWLTFKIVSVEQHNERERRAWHHYDWARQSSESGDRATAIAELDEALAVQPTLFQAYFLRGQPRQQQEEFEAAIADFTSAIDNVPPNAQHAEGAVAYLERGKCLAKVGHTEEAQRDFDEALKAGGASLRSAVDDARGLIKQQ
jgi:tetratricopeptide (TPR) repeat protein